MNLETYSNEKLINLAITIMNSFATTDDLDRICVSDPTSNRKTILISENYDYRMDKQLKHHILSLIEKKVSSTKVFRQLVRNLIIEDKIWAENNNETIMKKFPELNACIGSY